MANLYTKTGDKGETSLIGGSRVSKGILQVECYGTVDEMGAAIGYARSISKRTYIQEVLKSIQGRLFSLAGELACDETGLKKINNCIDQKDVLDLEAVVDRCTETTGPQKNFVVPGENPPSAALHYARTVVRRCERCMIRLSQQVPVRDTLLQYVNRLSDVLYALARLEETLINQEIIRQKVESEVRRQLQAYTKSQPFTLEHIEKMAKRATAKATEINVSIVFAAADAGGNLIFLKRMEHAYLGSIDVALNKAYTAVAFQKPTHILGESARCDGPLYGIEISNNGRIITFGGGYPYKYNGELVGGIGVSGGTVEEDMLIARYALGE